MNLVQSSQDLVFTVGKKRGAKSPQLKKALINGNHIITCTLQTFPEVMKLIEDIGQLRGRRWAVVADEAHSSQTGSSARRLKELLAGVDIDDDEDLSAEDLMVAKDSAIARSSNITFVALTATPKPKTLRLFGTKVEEERWEAFDTYTMTQAIEEGFILDVLANYSTYDMFLRVRNTLNDTEEDLQVETGKAVSKIIKYARLHPTSIAQKVRVVVEHFRRNVAHMLDGQAKAMVVTSTRQAAYHWSQKMNDYIAEQGYQGLETLVAFSGRLTGDDGEPVSEAAVNKRGDTADAFRNEDRYKVLIVANKFQTGFDEPRLMAMYIDKKLTGVATVQTLSRLNRIYPGKSSPMVLDFVNSPEDIQADFQTYYADAHISQYVDPEAIHEIGLRLDNADIYTRAEMDRLADAYLNQDGGESIAKALGPIKNRWNSLLHQANLSKDKNRREELEAFRSDIIAYRNAWQFLSQIVDYQDPVLHRRAILATLLARNLHLNASDYDDSFMHGVQLSRVKRRPAEVEVDRSISEGSTDPWELPGYNHEYQGKEAAERGPLDEAIDRVNEIFRSHSADVNGQTVAGFMTTFWGFLDDNEQAVTMAKNNTVEQIKSSEDFSNAVGFAIYQAFTETEEIREYVSDPQILEQIADISAEALHSQYHQQKPGGDTIG